MSHVEKNPAHRIEVTWVPVRDSRGRTHMEARWTVPQPDGRVALS